MCQQKMPASGGILAPKRVWCQRSCVELPRVRSRRLHAMTALRGFGLGRGEKRQQCPRILRMGRRCAHCGREYRVELDLRRQHADDFDPGEMHQLAQLLESELDLAACDE